jgi:hypothetical protein
MRLSGSQILNIKNTAMAIFGKNTKVFLFGSRLDDTKKGGDIDLFIKPIQIIDEDFCFELKLKFLIQLKKLVGERKIDVIIGHKNSNPAFINDIALTSKQL